MSDRFAAHVRELGDAYDDGDWAAVLRRAAENSGPRRGKLVVAITMICVLAVAVPAIAFSERLDLLFSFATKGTSIDARTFDLQTASALERVQASETVRLLTVREGVAFYLAKTPEGGLCPFTGPADKPRPSFLEFGCLNPTASANFPSPSHPVIDLSPLFGMTGLPGVYVSQLKGFAADGVKAVEVIGIDGDVLVSAPVVDNVYIAGRVPEPGSVPGRIGPASAIVATDHDGNTVWERQLEPRPGPPG